jgi:hypothetical protein
MMTTPQLFFYADGSRGAAELDQQWGDIRGLCFVLDLRAA